MKNRIVLVHQLDVKEPQHFLLKTPNSFELYSVRFPFIPLGYLSIACATVAIDSP